MPSRMPVLFHVYVPALVVIILSASCPTAARGSDGSGADQCRRAAEEAARKTGVPLQVLLALTLTETGRSQGGALQPWPWALNEGGNGQWFATKDEALTYLSEAVASGVGNIDVGCFQLNYHWHGAAFATLDQMMDPKANALYAARLVAGHATETGDWVTAAGAYHSATPAKAETYLARFRPIYASLGPADGFALPDPPDDPAAEPRANSFPLLLAGQSGSAGSLVPLVSSGRALFGGP